MNTKNLLLLSFIVLSSCTMQNPLVDELDKAEHYCEYIRARYDQRVNHDLIKISETRNPFDLLREAERYYINQPYENTMLGAYVANFKSNASKSVAFAKLCGQMWNNRKNREKYEELWYSWPLKSVELDFQQQLKTIETFQQWIERANHESADIKDIAQELKEISSDLQRTLAIIKEESLLNKIKENPLDTICSPDAQEKLEKVEYLYPLVEINKDYKESTGQTLCHGLCDVKLDSKKFEVILQILQKKGIIFICVIVNSKHR